MNRITALLFTLLISTLAFNSVAAQQPSTTRDIASELSRKVHEGDQPRATTIDSSAHSKLSAPADTLN